MILEKVPPGEDGFTILHAARNLRQVTQGATPAKVTPLIADANWHA